MNDLVIHEENRFAFYIKCTRGLPVDYFKIANQLNQYKITLLPISIEEFFQIRSTSLKFCLILNNTFESKGFVDKFRENYFKLALLFGGCILVEVSSFNVLEFARLMQNNIRYFHIQLPENIDLVCKKIAAIYYKDILKREIWPGGTKAKLPNDIDNEDVA